MLLLLLPLMMMMMMQKGRGVEEKRGNVGRGQRTTEGILNFGGDKEREEGQGGRQAIRRVEG